MRSVLKFMSIKINYKNNILKKSSKNLILFVEEGFNINNLKKHLTNIEFSYINDLLKNSDLKKDILFFEILFLYLILIDINFITLCTS